MARIDKVVQIVRATAGTALPSGTVIGVVITAGGSVFPSGTAAGQAADGVVCYGGSIVAGDTIGVMLRGEIVEFGGSAGSAYYAGVGGTLSLTSTNATKVGKTIEGGRLVVTM